MSYTLTLKAVGCGASGQGVGLLSQFFNFPAQGSHLDGQAFRPQHRTQEVRTVPNVEAAHGQRGPSRPLTSARSHLP